MTEPTLLRSVAQVSIALTVVIVAATGAVVMAFGGTAGQAVVWGVVLAVAARVLPILASFLIAYWPRRDGRAFPLGLPVTAHAVAREFWATILLFFFYHPFESLVTRRDPERVEPGTIPIVLVHGFYANAGFWHRIRQRLTARGQRNLFALNLTPPFADIDEYAAQLAAHIERVCGRCGVESVIVVAHSMGGLVARVCAHRVPGRIRHVVCLGTPHAGTLPASLVPAPNTRQMRLESQWLANLNARSDAAPVINLYSEHDNIIVPQASAALSGAENIRLSGIGHLDMAFSPVMINTLEQVLARTRAGPVT